MQVLAISTPRNSAQAKLVEGQHRLRAEVFDGRLGWQVNVEDGMEADVFDGLQPTYILALGRDGSVAGCARLLPALGPTMVRDVFPSLLTNGRLDAHAAMIESSRFCVNTSIEEGRSSGSVHEATLTMFAGIVEWCMSHGYQEIVTVTDLRFERILGRVGWPLQRLGSPKKIGVTTAVAGILPANPEVFSRLRPSNYRSLISAPITQAA